MSDTFEYYQYHTPQVRALIWSLLSPALSIPSEQYPAAVSQQWCEQTYSRIKTSLEQLDSHPEPLLNWLEQYKSWRLGIRFEAYWAYILELLKQQRHILDWSAHIQVNAPLSEQKQNPAGQTLGELDFVYQDNNKQFNHLELAVKFYLLKPDEFGYERLVGPNGQDWYERKLIHLFQKQLPLSATAQARQEIARVKAFKTIGEDEINCRQQGLIKGMLFLPVTGQGELNSHERQCLNPDAVTGLWATQDNWYLADPGQVGRWVILDKLNWLVPQVFWSVHDEMYTFKEMDYKIKIHFHATKRSLLIARLEYDEQQQTWLEQQRIMVVDRYWPSYKKIKNEVTGKKITEQSDEPASDSDIVIEGVPVNA